MQERRSLCFARYRIVGGGLCSGRIIRCVHKSVQVHELDSNKIEENHASVLRCAERVCASGSLAYNMP